MKKINSLLFFLMLFTAFNVQGKTGENYITQLFKVGREPSASTIISKINGNTEYNVTPGDIYTIFIRAKKAFNGGNSDVTFNLALSNTYELEIPYIGTQILRGLTFFQARDMIIKKLKNALPTLEFVDFSLKAPAIFEIFVYGNVAAPGFIDVTALNHVHEAIALCGGLLPGGSYRKMEVQTGASTRELDFLLYHSRADISQNPYLEPGMKIFVPAAEILVQVDGSVAYPGLYELKKGETLKDLITMCGGLLPESDAAGIQLSSLNTGTEVTISYPEADAWNQIELSHADVVYVPSGLANRPTVLIEGAIYAKPGSGTSPREIPLTPVLFTIPYLPGMTLLEVLELYGGPTPFANAENSMIIRKNGDNLAIDIRKLWDSRDRTLDITLTAGDHLFIPIKNMKVIVSGMVNSPGDFPFMTKSTVGDYLLLAGGINPDKGSQRAIYLISPSGSKARLDLTDTLSPGDVIYVGKNSWGNTEYTIGQISTIVGITAAVVALTQTTLELITYARDHF